MKITFPHMGNTFIVTKALLDSLGVDYIIPPPNSKKDLEIGIKYCPEMACIPLKLNIGNFIQAIEQGADTILMVGGFGPCRLGYYGEMHQEILMDNDFKVDVVILEVSKGQIREFVNKVKKISNGKSYFKIIRAVKDAIKIAHYVDDLERLTFKTRPREIFKGDTDRIYSDFLNNVTHVKGPEQIMELIKDTRQKLLGIQLEKDSNPIRVGMVGEIYSIIEPFTNFNIEKKLGSMGIEVDRSIMLSYWIKEHIVKKVLFLKKDTAFKEAAKPYLGAMIGGHAQETIGNSILYYKKGFDGVIQIYPLTCMPEIVADSILPTISKEQGIPVLTLIVDEMTGEEGFKTRIEAFVDLLQSRRETESSNGRPILSWN